MESRAKGITDDLEDIPIVPFDGRSQKGVMPLA
jgi:hypothetical protein